jgi:hypothetical protein
MTVHCDVAETLRLTSAEYARRQAFREYVVNDTVGQAPSFSSTLVLFYREHQMLIGQAREHGVRLIGICDV